MSLETETVEAPVGARVNVSSYMEGNRMRDMVAVNVADILKAQNISTTDVQIEILDLQGNQKPGRANTVLADGDTVQIMRKSNKSGRTTNGVANIDIGVATHVTMLYKVPEKTAQVAGSRSKYRLHELTKKGASFDVPFTPGNGKQTKKVQQRVTSAITSYRRKHRNHEFVTRLLMINTKDRHNFRTLGRSNTHTHVIRVWRSK